MSSPGGTPTHPPASEEETLNRRKSCPGLVDLPIPSAALVSHYAIKRAGLCLLLLLLFSSLFRSVFPKEWERSIFTVVVWLNVVAFCQTGNQARFCTAKGEYGIGIASNAENVTADRKGKYGWIGQYDSWNSSKVHSYFPSDHLVPILTGRESGNLVMTAVFHSSSPKHFLLLQVKL